VGGLGGADVGEHGRGVVTDWYLVIALFMTPPNVIPPSAFAADRPTTVLGPIPDMNLCLDLAKALEAAAPGRVLAGCTIGNLTPGPAIRRREP